MADDAGRGKSETRWGEAVGAWPQARHWLPSLRQAARPAQDLSMCWLTDCGRRPASWRANIDDIDGGAFHARMEQAFWTCPGRLESVHATAKELARLRKENEILRAERDLLKKAAASSLYPSVPVLLRLGNSLTFCPNFRRHFSMPPIRGSAPPSPSERSGRSDSNVRHRW